MPGPVKFQRLNKRAVSFGPLSVRIARHFKHGIGRRIVIKITAIVTKDEARFGHRFDERIMKYGFSLKEHSLRLQKHTQPIVLYYEAGIDTSWGCSGFDMRTYLSDTTSD